MAERWISPTGNDSNPGTFEYPWKTPNKAFSWLNSSGSPGDIIWCRGGATLDLADRSELTKDGVSGNPIVIQAWASEVPIWDGTLSNVTSGGQWRISADYINITGIHFRNAPKVGLEYNGQHCNFTRLSSYGHALSAYYTDSGQHNSFSKCIAHDCYS